MEGNGSQQDLVAMTLVVSLIRPGLRRLLSGYRIPPASMVDVLERALLAAVETWDEDADRGDWLLKAVELECCAYWRVRHRRPPAAGRVARPPARGPARPLGGPAAGRGAPQAMRRARPRVVLAWDGAARRPRQVAAAGVAPPDDLS